MRFEFLKPADITPRGWIKKQLELQSEGLVGNLDKIWPDVAESRWIGGDREGWERFPYFLDGYIPMAYLLRDEEKIARIKKYVDTIISSQTEGGAYVPEGTEVGDVWSVFLTAKVMTVYADCCDDPDEENRVLESLKKCINFFDKRLGYIPPSVWGEARWFEFLIPVIWVLKRSPEDWIIRFAKRLKIYGLDYEQARSLWNAACPFETWSLENHVVNIGMALKSEAVYCEATGERMTGLAERMLDVLTEYHGTAYGHFNGDECLSGTDPSHGSELCGVVEAMYSYEWLTAVTGDGKWGDRLEALAFNGLPATCSEDMWTHQYDQQVNQIACIRYEQSPFFTNGGESNTFGLEPNYGCCTANMGQGFPKFMLSAYMKYNDWLAIVSPVSAAIAFGGGEVTVSGEYPFRNSFSLSASKDTKITLRIPAWAKPVISTGFVQKDGWADFTVKAGGTVTVEYVTEPGFEACSKDRVCVKYGALLFSLPLEYEKQISEYEANGVTRRFPYCDYTFTPKSPWNYAYASDRLEVVECDYTVPFSRTDPPVRIKATVAPVKWDHAPGHPYVPLNVCASERTGENEERELYPYGATYLRMTEMARID